MKKLMIVVVALSLWALPSIVLSCPNVTYNHTTGRLIIPCADVPDGNGVTHTFSVGLQKGSSGYVFDLDLNTIIAATQYSLGNYGPAGGMVFNIDSSGLHGLEAQLSDYSNRISFQDATTGVTSYGEGWRLPTLDELNLLYQGRDLVGGFATNDAYWSTTKINGGRAWVQSFPSGYQYDPTFATTLRVRAIRAF